MAGIDGRVTGLNQDAFQAAKFAQIRKSTAPKGVTEANVLKNAILKDNKIDSAEQDLINEFTSDSGQKVNISAQQTAGFSPQDISFNNKWSSEAIDIIKDIKPKENISQLDSLWNSGAKGFKEITKIYQSSPENKEKVLNFLEGKTKTAWDKSGITNAYSPLKGLISTAYSGVNQLSGDDNTAGRTMLHEAIKRVDTTESGGNGSIPDFLYNWIRPGGYI